MKATRSVTDKGMAAPPGEVGVPAIVPGRRTGGQRAGHGRLGNRRRSGQPPGRFLWRPAGPRGTVLGWKSAGNMAPGTGAMHILCPHCRNPIEIVPPEPSAEVACPSCGSTFRVSDPSTVGWAAPERKSLGRFELIEAVGQGAFGTVYRARDPELDRTVALKVPRRGNVGEHPQDLDRFLREARSAAQLRHPSIVSVHEVGTSEGVP